MNAMRRIGAMVLRYTYLVRRSWPRILELVYWPTVQLILWGFITQFFLTNSSWLAQASGVLLAAVMLWDVMFRGHLGVSLAFFEEMYSRNLGHLFASPLRAGELVASLLVISTIRTLIGVGGAALLAIPMFGYSIFGLGVPLIAFFANLLVMGWAIGLVRLPIRPGGSGAGGCDSGGHCPAHRIGLPPDAPGAPAGRPKQIIPGSIPSSLQ